MTRPPNPGLADSLLVTTTTIHCSFADRRRLFEAPRLRASDELDAAVAVVVDPSAEALERMAEVAEAFAALCLHHPHRCALVVDALPPYTEPDEALTRRSSARFVRLGSVVERGARSREIRVDDVDLAAMVGFATPFGVVHLFLAGRLPAGAAAAPGRGATAAATRGRRAGGARRRARVVRAPFTRPRPARPTRAGRSSRRQQTTLY